MSSFRLTRTMANSIPSWWRHLKASMLTGLDTSTPWVAKVEQGNHKHTRRAKRNMGKLQKMKESQRVSKLSKCQRRSHWKLRKFLGAVGNQQDEMNTFPKIMQSRIQHNTSFPHHPTYLSPLFNVVKLNQPSLALLAQLIGQTKVEHGFPFRMIQEPIVSRRVDGFLSIRRICPSS